MNTNAITIVKNIDSPSNNNIGDFDITGSSLVLTRNETTIPINKIAVNKYVFSLIPDHVYCAGENNVAHMEKVSASDCARNGIQPGMTIGNVNNRPMILRTMFEKRVK